MKHRFTKEDAAEMRRQYEDKVSLKLICAQYGLKGGGMYDVVFRLFRKYDPDFKTFLQRRSEADRWCPWCGNDMPPFAKTKYCDDPECKADRAPPSKYTHCADCGGKKAWRASSTCKKCERKRFKAKKGERLRIIYYMALGGYNTRQIAKKIGLSESRTLQYRSQLKHKIPPARRAGSWLPEQEEYWKAKVIEAGSAKAVWEKSGLTYSAFLTRLHRIGFRARKEHTHENSTAQRTAAAGNGRTNHRSLQGMPEHLESLS